MVALKLLSIRAYTIRWTNKCQRQPTLEGEEFAIFSEKESPNHNSTKEVAGQPQNSKIRRGNTGCTDELLRTNKLLNDSGKNLTSSCSMQDEGNIRFIAGYNQAIHYNSRTMVVIHLMP